ncbi:DUF4214 domain-containing protein [Subtercola vilae]|uniref:DUF4214 domain-containing protein n=1 Tax=Subtercola vilae TaxID=2056433 RepID=UPI001376064A|nr:DUF4214 domain-containing protein [Subtercola vilae]
MTKTLFNGDYSSLNLFASNGATPTGGTSLDARYITALYGDYLGRAPSSDDINFWEARLAAGYPRGSISAGFVGSDEYRLDRIDAAYQSILGRAPDPSGRVNWLNTMRAGVITTDDIETSLYASQEYFLQHCSTAAPTPDLLHRCIQLCWGASVVRQTIASGRSWLPRTVAIRSSHASGIRPSPSPSA